MTLNVHNFILHRLLNQFHFQLPVPFNSEVNVHSAAELFLRSVYIIAIGFVEKIIDHSALGIRHPVIIFDAAKLIHVAYVYGGHKDTPDWWGVVVCARRGLKLLPIIKNWNILLSFAHKVFAADDD